MPAAYVMPNGLRVTQASRFFLPEDSTPGVLQALVGRITNMDMKVKCLFLNKGFAGAETMTYLESSGQPALTACPIRGSTGGTRACAVETSAMARPLPSRDKTATPSQPIWLSVGSMPRPNAPRACSDVLSGWSSSSFT